ncbi:MAG: hypothetical protein GY757_28365, partial [bacterium]|nr:hypothetical protein [bacterium]
NEAVQTSFLSGNIKEMEKYVKLILKYGRKILDKAVAYEYRIMAYIAENHSHQAVETLLEVFEKLGVTIPREPGNRETSELFANVQAVVNDKEGLRLKESLKMTDPKKLLTLKLFSIGIGGFMYARPELYPIATLKMMCLCIEHGLAPETPFILSLFGALENYGGNNSGAYRVGKMAMDLLEKNTAYDISIPKTVYMVCAYQLGWKEHFKEVADKTP